MTMTGNLAFRNAFEWLFYTIVGLFCAFVWTVLGSEIFLTPDITVTQYFNLTIIIALIAFFIWVYFVMAGALRSIGTIVEQIQK